MGLTTQKNYRTFLYINTLVIVVLGAAIAGGGLLLLLPADIGQGFHDTLAAVQAIRKVLFWKIAVDVCGYFCFHRCRDHGAPPDLLPPYRRSSLPYRSEAAKIGGGNLTGNITFRQKTTSLT